MAEPLEQAVKRFMLLAGRMRKMRLAALPVEFTDISPALLTFLEFIHTNPGCGVQKIAALMGLATPTVSVGIRKLEAAGYLERRPHPEDGRAVNLFLTPSGEVIYDRVHQYHQRRFSSLLAGLDPQEQSTLLDLLEKAIRIAEETQETPS